MNREAIDAARKGLGEKFPADVSVTIHVHQEYNCKRLDDPDNWVWVDAFPRACQSLETARMLAGNIQTDKHLRAVRIVERTTTTTERVLP